MYVCGMFRAQASAVHAKHAHHIIDEALRALRLVDQTKQPQMTLTFRFE